MNSIKSTKNILNAFFIPEITHLIQWYALPDDIIFKKRMGDVIKNINILIREKKNNRGIHEYYNINLEKLTFFKYYKISLNQNYHAQQCIKTIGKLRASSIVNKTPSTNLIYGREALIIYEFLNYIKCGAKPLTYEILKLITKLDKYFLAYSREEMCQAIIKKSKKNYHMCCCKRVINNNKLSFFCKRHLKTDIIKNNLMIKNNLDFIENYKIKSNHPLIIDNYEIPYKKIKKHF